MTQQSRIRIARRPLTRAIKQVLHRALVTSLLLAPFSIARADDLLGIFTLAQQQDAQLAEARARFEAEHTQLYQARANLLPTVSLNARSARNAQAPELAFSYADGFNSHGYGINMEQSLVNMQAWYGWKAAKASDQRSIATFAQAEQELIMRVARAYFDVLRSQEALTAFTAEENAAATVLQQTQQRFDVGLVAITDVNDAQANNDLARVNRLREERTLNQRRLSLEVITGQTHDELDALRQDFPIVSVAPVSADEWVALAASNSPAIKIAEADFSARGHEAKAARAAMLPTLSLSANFNDNAESANPFSFFPNTASNSATVQLNLNVPIFTGGANSARKSQAYHLRDASEQVLVRTKRENERNTRDSFLGIETDVLAVQARQQAVLSASSALAAAEAGASIGTRNTVDVVLAQRTMFQAQRDYAAARYDYVIDTLSLKQAAGVLTPEDVRALNEWLD